MWKKLSRKFEPITGASKTRLRNTFAEYKLYDVTRKPKEFITNIKLFIVDLRKPDVNIDDS